MRPYYTEYVRHAMRFYAKYPNAAPQNFRSNADRQNWNACHKVVRRLPEKERLALLRLYQETGDFADCVYETSRASRKELDGVWEEIRRIERKIARRRGLL